MKKINYLLIGLLAFFISSCINEEGEGGTSIIQGYVYKVIHEDDIYSFKTDTFPAAKTDVYIVYGNQPIYGDKMETGYDGFYQFRYLNKGAYKLYSYTTLSNGEKEAVMDSVTIGSGDTKTLNNIYIHEGKSYETSYIKGRVLATYYNKGNAISVATPAFGVRVFIRKVGSPYQFDEVRTGLDGVFMFQKIEPGDYEVFTFTEDPNTEILSPVTQTVTVSEKGVIKTLSNDLRINITT